MYYPYLRGKQFELLALREFSTRSRNNERIIPIIEPVKTQFNGLNSATTAMLENGLKFALVLNPNDGDFKHQEDNDVLGHIPGLIDRKEDWIPAYIYKNDGTKLSDIVDLAMSHGLNNLMIIFTSSADVNDKEVISFLANENITCIVASGLNNNRHARAELLNLNKKVISLEDKFNDRTRNVDYATEEDEMFSDDFAFYQADRLAGFADYTLMAKDFAEGGMLPYAIAIHLTYQKSDNQIFVHHFVSDSNYDQSNIRGKFHEAAIKIEPFYREGGYVHTNAVDELIEKASSDNGYPGLGYIKKLSLLNHLELMDRILAR